MRVSISNNRNSLEYGDNYFVINRDDFYEYVDQKDFECRNSLTIVSAYHESWFEAENAFLPPILFIHQGKIQFINGRHRTALLFESLVEIPVIFLSPNAKKFSTIEEILSNKELINKLAKPLQLDQHFEFPDLPIRNLD